MRDVGRRRIEERREVLVHRCCRTVVRARFRLAGREERVGVGIELSAAAHCVAGATRREHKLNDRPIDCILEVACWTSGSEETARRWGALLLVSGATIAYLVWRRTLRGATTVHGKVVDHIWKTGDEFAAKYPVIQFRDADEEPVRFESALGASFDRWPVGTYVSVRTDRGKLEHYDPSFVIQAGLMAVSVALLILLV